MSITKMFAARNMRPAAQSGMKTFWPLNSSMYAHISQCSWDPIHTNIQARPFHFSFMVVQGRMRGSRQKNHTKYCAVMTLLNATNATVWRNKQNGRSLEKRRMSASCTISCGRKEASFCILENPC
ncbi:Os03g0670366 [Oryza sativa Japonica Group]|uniref:Os03g0670366 protein n=1 Tax=Oryza sativa subsp. japonica TaxID=39947 RepID=A0A0N7KHT1_ORYSJ|nr:hypothetical protein EE612_019560 [Oryza sativa]BAS85681.1 Os03g0670366 [Oryza sativa Japonica Group]